MLLLDFTKNIYQNHLKLNSLTVVSLKKLLRLTKNSSGKIISLRCVIGKILATIWGSFESSITYHMKISNKC